MKYLAMYLVVFLLFMVGCSTTKDVRNDEQRAAFQLDTVEKIQVGKDDKAKILKLLGPPDQELKLEKIPQSNDDGTVWLYYEGPFRGQSRISAYFAKGSNIVSSVGWNVREGEAEQNLKVVQNRLGGKFQGAKFEAIDGGWLNPHAHSDLMYYEDKKLGLVIFYRMTREEVRAITWSDPKGLAKMTRKKGRSLSSVHCIGGLCTPYVKSSND